MSKALILVKHSFLCIVAAMPSRRRMRLSVWPKPTVSPAAVVWFALPDVTSLAPLLAFACRCSSAQQKVRFASRTYQGTIASRSLTQSSLS